jgi:hypothetical protein
VATLRVTAIVFTTIMALVAGWAHAKTPLEPGGSGYVDTKHPKISKDYYIVRKGDTNQCDIESGDWTKKPENAVGNAPYASKDYAKAALKKFPECKDTKTDEAPGKKHRKK